MLTSLLIVAALVGGSFSASLPWDVKAPTIVSRAGWGARPPYSITYMSTPVANVVIHHTYVPGACSTQTACVSAVKSVQNSHMDGNGWSDIGYSFLVGGDNRAYEGRSWDKVGAHAPGFNDRSVGINLIGDWTSNLPPAAQLQVVKDLIAYGVSIGRITSNYRLLGHRQAIATECPGTRLYNEIRTWPHFSSASIDDILAEEGPIV